MPKKIQKKKCTKKNKKYKKHQQLCFCLHKNTHNVQAEPEPKHKKVPKAPKVQKYHSPSSALNVSRNLMCVWDFSN